MSSTEQGGDSYTYLEVYPIKKSKKIIKYLLVVYLNGDQKLSKVKKLHAAWKVTTREIVNVNCMN